jgi:hypothetical protein
MEPMPQSSTERAARAIDRIPTSRNQQDSGASHQNPPHGATFAASAIGVQPGGYDADEMAALLDEQAPDTLPAPPSETPAAPALGYLDGELAVLLGEGSS